MSGIRAQTPPRKPAFSIRPARSSDTELMRMLEVDAGKRFLEIGLDDIANAEPPDHNEFIAAINANMCWVAYETIDGNDLDGLIAGYASAEIVDGAGHLHQVSVSDILQGQGLGRLLIEHVTGWAVELGFDSLTLTTFADVSWNGPLYEHLGFREITPKPGSELQAIRESEVAAGLDVQRRIAMSLDLK